MKKFATLIVATLLCALLVLPTAANALPGRIRFTPSTASLTEGESQLVSVALDEPIICPTMDSTCVVTLPLVVSDPTRATTSVDHITFASSEWATTKTFTVTALNDYVANTSNTITVGATAVSNSEYYSGFHPTMTLTLTDLGAAPAPTTGFGDAQAQSLSVVAGKTISLSGSGYKPDTEVTVTLHSTPTVLGTARTNSSGGFSSTFTVAKTTTLGAHEVVVSGFELGGVSTTATLSLTVTGLANSGSESQYLTLVGITMVLLGIGMCIYSRKSNVCKHVPRCSSAS